MLSDNQNFFQKMLTVAIFMLTLLAFQQTANAAGCFYYEHANFKGAQHRLGPNTGQRFVGRFWNDRISAIHVTPQCTLTAFQHANYHGDRRVFRGTTRYVGNLWNDQISSVQCHCKRPIGRPVRPAKKCIAYQHANFRGKAMTIRGNSKQSWVGGFFNDQTSSFRVSPGCRVIAYQHKDFRGDRRVFGNTSFVGNLWNDQMSSWACQCR